MENTIEQRSTEWFQQRVGKVTGSNIGAILGLSPFRKPRDVIRSMVREYHGAESEFEGNIATSYGNQHEAMATFDFQLETGLDVIETGFHTHPDHEWLGASPDGLIGDDDVIEVKCPFGLRNGGEFKPLGLQPHYFAQVQYEMYCTGRKRNHFYQWSSHDTKLELVELDQDYIDRTLPLLREFYDQYLVEIKAPDKHLAPLVKHREADHLVAVYTKAKEDMERAKEAMDDARLQLIEMAAGQKSNISGLLIYPIERKGSISYAKVIKDVMPDLDLEQYRGESSTTWGVK